MDSDLFDSIIKVDDGYSESDDEIADKENKKLENVKSFKAKKQQFSKINEFMNQFKEEAVGKEKFSELWKVLVSEVNELGPPIYTEVEWKTKWSQHKYNLKRKWLTKSTIQDQRQTVHTMGDFSHATPTIQGAEFSIEGAEFSIQGAEFSIQDHPQHTISDIFDMRSTIQVPGAQDTQDQPQLVQTIALGETINNSDVLDKLDQIIERQDAVLVKMDQTNSLLEIIARRAN